ncbi:MAG: 4Fe-4S binding protein [Spirochaetaceae bacterium]|nr:4Fe-4S binding protein [Spirochaetaceae bacterium]
MKKLGNLLLSKKPFREIVMGNTALVRAMIESGTEVITSYPGSPTPEIASSISSIEIAKRPFYFEFSTNEKVAMEIAYGAAINGQLSAVFFKSVGLNVASDTFMQLSLMNIIGGMVVILGDDPGLHSSQNEQDNRHYAKMSYTPLLEPSSPQEAYDYYLEAAALAKKKHIPVLLRLTTHVCHTKQKVSFSSWDGDAEKKESLFHSTNGPYIPITSKVIPMKTRALTNISSIENDGIADSFATLVNNSNKKQGIITMGMPFLSLLDVLSNIDSPPDILKLGMTYPLPKQKVIDFLKDHEEIKILEELDSEIEQMIKAFAFDDALTGLKIMGKQNIEDWIGEYTPEKITLMLSSIWPEMVKHLIPETRKGTLKPRPPQLCPGCGHRSAFHAIKKALKEEDITVADIGCHTLGHLPPYNMGEVLMCMGASPAIASGLSLNRGSRNIIAFMGDSTFYHAAMPSVVNALFNNHDFTMILMENGTTAMTGHQDNPSSGKNFNEPAEKIPIRKVLEGFGVQHIFEIDTYKQKELTSIVKEAVSLKGFSVIIAKHPCMLKLTRQNRKKKSHSLKHVEINHNLCQMHKDCIEDFACPSFSISDNGQIQVNKDLCIGDGSCRQTCPISAINYPSEEKTI